MSIADTVPTAETAAEPVQPFSSLSELRSEHLKLLRAMRSEKGEDLIRRVADFLSRAQETGTLIDERADREARTALGRIGRPEEVAAAVAFWGMRRRVLHPSPSPGERVAEGRVSSHSWKKGHRELPR